jgi:hypothetical protein
MQRVALSLALAFPVSILGRLQAHHICSTAQADLNGASYRNDLKQTVAKGQHHLSRAAWLYELQMADDDAA